MRGQSAMGFILVYKRIKLWTYLLTESVSVVDFRYKLKKFKDYIIKVAFLKGDKDYSFFVLIYYFKNI
jgi:hypothetical protein